MSNYQILARLYGGLVGHDAVFRYTYAVETGTDGAQTADYHCVIQAGDDDGQPEGRWERRERFPIYTDDPYIAINDRPKVANLQKLFPGLYAAEPKLSK